MSGNQSLQTVFHTQMENPLIWPILEVLKRECSGWKVHTLSTRLSELGYVPELDSSPGKDIFKRNFLIMNALYQLQEMLYPERWLQVEAMDIELRLVSSHVAYFIDQADPLRMYYTDWSNYEASEGEVKRLLNEFWSRYRQYIGQDDNVTDMDRARALRLFELPVDASDTEIRKTWRKLALRWHPDRDNGDSERFRTLCEAWHILRQTAADKMIG
ncbi:DNA-J related domain-containing protein [Vibrio rhizosphaerae]|uniref:DNA-J related domain-containing protein n=1 Tax=Vibrio rhizosphaerae TaxID=398736 RepID=A0ABU4IX33_9VIBR|nr:DNA-J related domain-containing protein [Vibrio rhizosphaerae]MDW6093952.1 DNA-J related domain-containing protein [Vibrio rhizosphaerae]